jgi:hypothetical protein
MLLALFALMILLIPVKTTNGSAPYSLHHLTLCQRVTPPQTAQSL